jgi:hypothetical protein
MFLETTAPQASAKTPVIKVQGGDFQAQILYFSRRNEIFERGDIHVFYKNGPGRDRGLDGYWGTGSSTAIHDAHNNQVDACAT